MKNIYKDEVIGNINSNLIYNNEIKGVFGTLISTSISNELGLVETQHMDSDVFSYTWRYVNDQEFAPPTGTTYDNDVRVRNNIKVGLNTIELYFDFPTPIDSISSISGSIVTETRLSESGSFYWTQTSPEKQQEWMSIYNDLRAMPRIATMPTTPTEIIKYSEIPTIPKRIMNFNNHNTIYDALLLGSRTYTLNSTGVWNVGTIEVETINKFRIKVIIKITSSDTLSVSQDAGTPENRLYSYGNVYSASTKFVIPRSINIRINGRRIDTTSQSFQYGSKENAHEQTQSTLLTANSTYQGQQLWEHIGQRIVGQWDNGKQVVSLPTIINTEADIKEVNEETYIFNVRRGEIDENNQNQVNNASIFKTLDGTAKKYIIVNITNNYDGSMNQMLDLQEVIK